MQPKGAGVLAQGRREPDPHPERADCRRYVARRRSGFCCRLRTVGEEAERVPSGWSSSRQTFARSGGSAPSLATMAGRIDPAAPGAPALTRALEAAASL